MLHVNALKQDSQTAEQKPNDGMTLFDQEELGNFKAKTDELMQYLHQGDLSGVLRSINEINRINDENLYRIIGKITRGLHNAISDLQLSSSTGSAEEKARTRTGLGYVIDVTADAAKTTLDMTEKSRDELIRMSERLDEQNRLLGQLAAGVGADAQLQPLVSRLGTLLSENQSSVGALQGNVTEIIIAQNFQDLASQSITKSISNIRGVETSLIALTKHTNVLRQISQFTANPEMLNETDTEELASSLEQLELNTDNDHMDQDDVDNLLSSLGF
jgi:chemotaxis protein CheZ